jgi:hypothetical protein
MGASTPDSPVDKIGRVTGKISTNGPIGEVILQLHGGTTAYFARPADPTQEIEKNAVVTVIAYEPSTRTVYVSEEISITAVAETLAPPPV